MTRWATVYRSGRRLTRAAWTAKVGLWPHGVRVSRHRTCWGAQRAVRREVPMR